MQNSMDTLYCLSLMVSSWMVGLLPNTLPKTAQQGKKDGGLSSKAISFT